MTRPEWLPCPHCDDGKVEKRHPWYGQASCPSPIVDVTCTVCDGVGQIIKTEESEPPPGLDANDLFVWRLN